MEAEPEPEPGNDRRTEAAPEPRNYGQKANPESADPSIARLPRPRNARHRHTKRPAGRRRGGEACGPLFMRARCGTRLATQQPRVKLEFHPCGPSRPCSRGTARAGHPSRGQSRPCGRGDPRRGCVAFKRLRSPSHASIARCAPTGCAPAACVTCGGAWPPRYRPQPAPRR